MFLYNLPCVANTAGKIARLASLTARLLVSPSITEFFCTKVNNDNDAATSPPTNIEPLIK